MENHKRRTEDTWDKKGVQDPRKDTANPLHIRLGNDQATVSVLKLMMIEQVYVRRHLMRRTGQTIACCLPPFLTLRITFAYLAYMSMCCLTQLSDSNVALVGGH